MDDCLKFVVFIEEVVNFVKELRELFLRGGFNFIKWISNLREVFRTVLDVEWFKEVKTFDLD